MFLLRVKMIKQGEKRETSTKTCNETMLRDKLRVSVSRISPPLQQVCRARKQVTVRLAYSETGYCRLVLIDADLIKLMGSKKTDFSRACKGEIQGY